MDRPNNDTVDLIMRATVEYNKTLHSVINQKPIDVIHSASDEVKKAIQINIAKGQKDKLDRCNPSRQNTIFEVRENVYLKNNRRLRNKLTPFYTEKRAEADLGTAVLIGGRVEKINNISNTLSSGTSP